MVGTRVGLMPPKLEALAVRALAALGFSSAVSTGGHLPSGRYIAAGRKTGERIEKAVLAMVALISDNSLYFGVERR